MTWVKGNSDEIRWRAIGEAAQQDITYQLQQWYVEWRTSQPADLQLIRTIRNELFAWTTGAQHALQQELPGLPTGIREALLDFDRVEYQRLLAIYHAAEVALIYAESQDLLEWMLGGVMEIYRPATDARWRILCSGLWEVGEHPAKDLEATVIEHRNARLDDCIRFAGPGFRQAGSWDGAWDALGESMNRTARDLAASGELEAAMIEAFGTGR